MVLEDKHLNPAGSNDKVLQVYTRRNKGEISNMKMEVQEIVWSWGNECDQREQLKDVSNNNEKEELHQDYNEAINEEIILSFGIPETVKK